MIPFKEYFESDFNIEYKDDARYVYSRTDQWQPRDKSGLMLVDLKPGPYAVWYGFGKQWLEWMQVYKPTWISNYDGLFEIQIDHDHILKLDTPEKVILFNKLAGVADTGMIDWNSVARDYKGVEFNPYFQQLRADYPWYKNLSIASGVIFDPVNGIWDAELVWGRYGD